MVGVEGETLLVHHLAKLGPTQTPITVSVEPGKHLLNLLLRQGLAQLLHLALGDVPVFVLKCKNKNICVVFFKSVIPNLVVELEGQLCLLGRVHFWR